MSVNPLQGLLGKLGVSSYDELNEEERLTFNAWREALEGRKITDEDVARFFDSRFLESVGKATDPQSSEDVRRFYQMEVRLITKIKEFLSLPEKEKQMVENQIKTHN